MAIAGLIFLMVFLALPALRSGQRDNARKADVSTIIAAVQTYTSNNRGNFPTQSAFAPDQTPSGYSQEVSKNTTRITIGTAGADYVNVEAGQIVVVQRSTCGATGVAEDGTARQTLENGTANQYTVTTFVEAGNGSSFCQGS